MKAKIQAILAAIRNGETPGPKKYAHTYAHYSKLYGKSERTIKRWAAEGKPLDDPRLMQELLSPRGRKADAPTGDAPPPAPPLANDAESSPVTLDDDFFAGAGVLAAIERLEKAERERAGAYFRAISTRQPTAIVQNRFKEWMGIVEALRKLALDAPEIRKANELTIDVADVEAGTAHIFAAFRSAARNLPGRAAAKLLAARTREEFVAVLDAEIETLLRTLTEICVTEAAKAENPEAPEPDEPTPAPEPTAEEKPRKRKARKK